MEFFSPSFKDYYKSSNSEIFSSIFKNGFSTNMKSNGIYNKNFDVSDFNENFITQQNKKDSIKNNNINIKEIKSFFSNENNNIINKSKSNDNNKTKKKKNLSLKIFKEINLCDKKQKKTLNKKEIIINDEKNKKNKNKNKHNLFSSCCVIF